MCLFVTQIAMQSLQKFIIFVFVYAKVLTFVSCVNACQTPHHQPGDCRILFECPSLNNLIQHRPISPQSVEILRKSQCGFSGSRPKVCCPSQNVNNSRELEHITPHTISILQHNLLPTAKTCGLYTEDRLYRGAEVALDQYPWNALLKYKTKENNTEFYCAGVLISEKYVLTAAHCISERNLPKNSSLVSVRLGEHDIKTDPDCDHLDYCASPIQDVPIEETILHDLYDPDDPNYYHDIALIRLKSKISYTDLVSPLCLPGQKANYTERLIMRATGWGINNNNVSHSTKLSVQVRVKNSTFCEDAFKVKLNENQMCFGEKGCSSDSGGSLFIFAGGYDINAYLSVNAYLSAVKSFGSCDVVSRPMVYTRVDQYTNWIITNLKP